jgi:hypothetical protein
VVENDLTKLAIIFSRRQQNLSGGEDNIFSISIFPFHSEEIASYGVSVYKLLYESIQALTDLILFLIEKIIY